MTLFQVSVVPAAPAGTATPGERLLLPVSSQSGLSGRGSHIFRRLFARAHAGGEGRRRNT